MKRHAPFAALIGLAVCSSTFAAGGVSGMAFDLAACSATAEGGVWLRFLPAGEFRAQDGRPTECPSWRLTPERGQQLAASLNAKGSDVVIDYEHQTLHAEKNGQPAPAAGWCATKRWEMRADGLYALVQWTDTAAASIAAREYRYFSPVFAYNRKTGDVTAVLHGAITNSPALDGFSEIYARAAAKLTPQEDDDMKYKQLLLAILALKAEATDDDILAALTALDTKIKTLGGEAAASCSAVLDSLQTAVAAAKAAAPDPARFVPVAALNGVNTELAAARAEINELKAKGATDEVEQLVLAALADGRLIKATEDWARDLGKKDIAALKGFLEKAPKIAALTQQQGGDGPAVQKGKLSEDEIALCKNMGITQEAFLKARDGDVAAA